MEATYNGRVSGTLNSGAAIGGNNIFEASFMVGFQKEPPVTPGGGVDEGPSSAR